ncbi:MAG: Rne/Rng family ribonuclease [Clostridia bacterium]|nr:Rne/Rng family ribonuclease [Clostridia bacterium]
MLELIINKNKDIETICLVENGKLVEKYENNEETMKNRLEGNIYAGKVADIVPGMQSAFVDYGDSRKGLLHLKDAIPQVDEKSVKKEQSNKKISELLKQNQKILIQIKKDSNERKGAKISTHISIPSRYIVFMPNTEIITISQKIEDEKRKNELLELVRGNISSGNGAVIRTSAFDVSNEEIKKDIGRCEKKWKEILNEYEKSNPTELLYKSESVQAKILMDLKVDKVITNDQQEFESFKQLIKFEGIKGVKLEYSPSKDLLVMYDLSTQIKKSKDRKVWLNCGGFITIDKTEALTAIDVNTGKFTGKSDLESTIYKVNKEATIEIAKQLRLHDIGGIVIIDYIDMHIPENNEKIESLLKEELKKDRAKTQVEGFTKLNLMELTRKHICSHLNEV